MERVLYMIRPDLLVVQPSHVDFPYFRWMLDWDRSLFNGVHMCFSPGAPDRDITPFVRSNVNASFVDPIDDSDDWRDRAVHSLLESSKAEYVVFIEQDFLIKDIHFWHKVLSQDTEMILYLEDQRIHPAFALVKRSLVEETSKDFSAHPPESDHFGRFFRELKNLPVTWLSLTDVVDGGTGAAYHGGIDRTFVHLAGTTQNYSCFRDDQPLYQPNNFLAYNHGVRSLPVVQEAGFLQLCSDIESKLGVGDSPIVSSFFPS